MKGLLFLDSPVLLVGILYAISVVIAFAVLLVRVAKPHSIVNRARRLTPGTYRWSVATLVVLSIFWPLGLVVTGMIGCVRGFAGLRRAVIRRGRVQRRKYASAHDVWAESVH